MARRRFFVSEVRRGSAELTDSDAEHLVRVLRVEAGQVFELSDNRSVYLAEVESARKSSVMFRILEELPLPERSVQITLLAALIKFERFEWLLEKATELGVTVVQPIESVRTERGLAEGSRKRSTRWERILREASEQSRRAQLPQLKPVMRFNDALEMNSGIRFFLDENPGARAILDSVPSVRNAEDRVLLLLGPEGGWTEEERQRAIDIGWTACSLAGNVLRAETAALAALAVVQAAWRGTTAT
jgi:16S rRNA (uracil1498-N3)-methyltransferase